MSTPAERPPEPDSEMTTAIKFIGAVAKGLYHILPRADAESLEAAIARLRAAGVAERRDPPDAKAISLLYFAALERFQEAAQGDHDGTCSGTGCDKCFLTGVQPLLGALRAGGPARNVGPCEMNARCLGCQRSIVGCVQDSTCATRADCALKGYERALSGGGPAREEPLRKALQSCVDQIAAYEEQGWLGAAWRTRIGLREDLANARRALSRALIYFTHLAAFAGVFPTRVITPETVLGRASEAHAGGRHLDVGRQMVGVVPIGDESTVPFAVEKVPVTDTPPKPWEGYALINGLLLINGNVQRWARKGEQKGFARRDHIGEAFNHLVLGHDRGSRRDGLMKSDFSHKRRRLAIVGKDKLDSVKLTTSDLLRVESKDSRFRIMRASGWHERENYIATSDVRPLNMYGGSGRDVSGDGRLFGGISGLLGVLKTNLSVLKPSFSLLDPVFDLLQLPTEHQQLGNGDDDQIPSVPSDAAINRRFLATLAVSLLGLGFCLYGVQLNDKRRGASPALILLGLLLIGAGVAYWWFWSAWLL